MNPPGHDAYDAETRRTAEGLLRALASSVAVLDAEAGSALGAPRRDVTYARVWKRLVRAGRADRFELFWRARELVGFSTPDEDLECLFRAVDIENKNVITLQEFARFARRVALNPRPRTLAPPPTPERRTSASATRIDRPNAKDRKDAPPSTDAEGAAAARRSKDASIRRAAERCFFDLAAAVAAFDRRGARTPVESTANFARLFRTLDPCGRGSLDPREFKANALKFLPRRGGDVDALFAAVDIDDSGEIDVSEFATFARSVNYAAVAAARRVKDKAARARTRRKASSSRKGSAKRETRSHLSVARGPGAPPRVSLTQEERAKTARLFHKLAERISLDSDERAGGFGKTSVPPRGASFDENRGDLDSP